ncbi:urease subunit beta [Dactylosporangium sucinum]|uniref:Urease subunit beta n=1 Tax=Dactylosporangium sucinum TaxID=1424081 RepID=A0A917WUN6_9ACTN|nr:urease subunit beta [Dactylosporangium sucinum]GGM29551.1 urease subunit beta [Dactylosporangium sucinum]
MSKPSHAETRHKAIRPIGGYVLADEPLELNAGRPTSTIEVVNTGDRPVQVGSHFHFYEVNRYLEFDRDAAFGMRLDIPATTAVRFEPGDRKTIALVPFGGKQRVQGFNGLVDGWAGTGAPGYQPERSEAAARAARRGFKSRPATSEGDGTGTPATSRKPSAKERRG